MEVFIWIALIINFTIGVVALNRPQKVEIKEQKLSYGEIDFAISEALTNHEYSSADNPEFIKQVVAKINEYQIGSK